MGDVMDVIEARSLSAEVIIKFENDEWIIAQSDKIKVGKEIFMGIIEGSIRVNVSLQLKDSWDHCWTRLTDIYNRERATEGYIEIFDPGSRDFNV